MKNNPNKNLFEIMKENINAFFKNYIEKEVIKPWEREKKSKRIIQKYEPLNEKPKSIFYPNYQFHLEVSEHVI